MLQFSSRRATSINRQPQFPYTGFQNGKAYLSTDLSCFCPFFYWNKNNNRFAVVRSLKRKANFRGELCAWMALYNSIFFLCALVVRVIALLWAIVDCLNLLLKKAENCIARMLPYFKIFLNAGNLQAAR